MLPGFRTLVPGAIAAIGVGLFLNASTGWPAFVAIAIGALVGLVVAIVATSLGEDPTAADAAWRAASRDLDGDADIAR